jgi:protein-tyrosine phosphatase
VVESIAGVKMPQEEVIRKYMHWLDRHYGSRQGAVRTYWHRFLYLLGRYRRYRDVDWGSVQRLVFVCKGNICRSAYAEAVARSMGVETISCGIDAIEDAPANKDAILAASSQGFDLKGHKTKPIMYLVLRHTDLLVAMEPCQAKFLDSHLTRKHYCTLLGLWTKPILPHIQDPYGSSSAYFETCFGYIQKTVYELARKIEKKTGN